MLDSHDSFSRLDGWDHPLTRHPPPIAISLTLTHFSYSKPDLAHLAEFVHHHISIGVFHIVASIPLPLSHKSSLDVARLFDESISQGQLSIASHHSVGDESLTQSLLGVTLGNRILCGLQKELYSIYFNGLVDFVIPLSNHDFILPSFQHDPFQSTTRKDMKMCDLIIPKTTIGIDPTPSLWYGQAEMHSITNRETIIVPRLVIGSGSAGGGLHPLCENDFFYHICSFEVARNHIFSNSLADTTVCQSYRDKHFRLALRSLKESRLELFLTIPASSTRPVKKENWQSFHDLCEQEGLAPFS